MLASKLKIFILAMPEQISGFVNRFNDLWNFLPTYVKILFCSVIFFGFLTVISILIDSLRRKRKIANLANTTPQQLSVLGSPEAKLSDLILNSYKFKITLFGGSGISALPVTIPVKTSAALAEKGKKILLIDLDLKRDPVSKVFKDDQTNSALISIQNTFIENLDYYPASNFTATQQMNVKQLIETNASKYDHIILYCPTLDSSTDRKQFASIAEQGFIFALEDSQLNRLLSLFRENSCIIRACFFSSQKVESIPA